MDASVEQHYDALIRSGARRLTGYQRRHPTVKRLQGEYPDGVRVSAKEMKPIEARLHRSATLPKYHITIKPRATELQVK